MSLLDARDYTAVFATPEGGTYQVPLVCWREDGDQMYGVALIKGHLRRAEQLQGFLRYAARDGADSAVPFEVPRPERRRRDVLPVQVG